MSSRRLATVVAGAAALLLCCAVPVQAALLTLSTHASDGINPPDANQLDATFEFSINLSGQLLLTVHNSTPEDPLNDPALKINEIYFNAKSNIMDLDFVDVSEGNTGKWVWGFLQGGSDGDGNPHQVDSFGRFDTYVKDKTGSPETYINSGGSLTFTFNISWTGTAPLDTDFIELSAQVDDHTISYAAAKFYNGPPEMSAYGATNIPEPATIALLGLGALALLRKRKRA